MSVKVGGSLGCGGNRTVRPSGWSGRSIGIAGKIFGELQSQPMCLGLSLFLARLNNRSHVSNEFQMIKMKLHEQDA